MQTPNTDHASEDTSGSFVVKGLIVVRAKQAAVKCDLLRCDATGPFLSARNSAEYVDVYEWLLMAYATSVTVYYGSPFNAGGESP